MGKLKHREYLAQGHTANAMANPEVELGVESLWASGHLAAVVFRLDGGPEKLCCNEQDICGLQQSSGVRYPETLRTPAQSVPILVGPPDPTCPAAWPVSPGITGLLECPVAQSFPRTNSASEELLGWDSRRASPHGTAPGSRPGHGPCPAPGGWVYRAAQPHEPTEQIRKENSLTHYLHH